MILPHTEGEQIDDITYREGGRNAEVRKADRKAYLQWASNREWKKRLT